MNKSSFMELPPIESRGRGRCMPTSPPMSTGNPVGSPLISPAATMPNYSAALQGMTSRPLWRGQGVGPSVEVKPKELRRPKSVTPIHTPSPETTAQPLAEPPADPPAEPPAEPQEVPEIPAASLPAVEPLPISTLSVDAKEFVPRGRISLESLPLNDVKEFVPRSQQKSAEPLHEFPTFVPRAHFQVTDTLPDEFVPRQRENDSEVWEDQTQQAEYHRPARDDTTSPKEVAVTHLTEVMDHMTLLPESFDKMVDALVDAFACWMEEPETTVAVVDALFERSLTDANFRFNGVRLCGLINNLTGNAFRTPLLKRCAQEHTASLACIASEPRRTHGYLLLVSDLFVNLEVLPNSKQKIDVLGHAAIEVLNALLNAPTHDNVKCVCQALKLAGCHLSAFDKESVDGLFSRLHKLQIDRSTAGPTQLLILQVTLLRREKWGLVPPGVAPAPAPAVNTSNGPTFYGPDGKVLTPEESQFLQDNASPATDEADTFRDTVWEQDEEMDDEIQAAFEQFLRLGRN